MSYAELTAVPKLVVGEKDVRTNEYVTYIASLDEDSVRRERRDALCIRVGLLILCLLHLNPCAIIYCCIIAATVRTYSEVMKCWELYVTERALCYVNPYAPQGMDFFAIPLAHIASVKNQMLGVNHANTRALVITLKDSAPPITIQRGRQLVNCRTYYIKFVKDTDYFIEVLKQWIHVDF